MPVRRPRLLGPGGRRPRHGQDARPPRAPRPRTAAEQIIAAAAADPKSRTAVAAAAHALGRGIGALVNGLDPDVVTLSGLATDLAGTAPVALETGYNAALMRYRRATPPPSARQPWAPWAP